MRVRAFRSVLPVVAIVATLPFSGGAAPSDKAAEVLAAARKELGGKKLESLKTLAVEGSVQRNLANIQLGGDVEFLIEMPDKYSRSETMSRGPMPISMTSVVGFNGDRGIGRVNAPGMSGGGMQIRMVGPGGATINGEKPTPEQEAQMKAAALRGARHDASRLMLGWFAMAHPSINPQYTYAGEAESPDGKADVIDVKGADNFEARLFIDQQTRLPLMVTYKAPQMRVMQRSGGPGGGANTPANREHMKEEMDRMLSQPPAMAEYTLFFSDWREVDGIRFPHQIQRAASGTTDEEWTLSKVKVNPRIDPKKFESQ